MSSLQKAPVDHGTILKKTVTPYHRSNYILQHEKHGYRTNVTKFLSWSIKRMAVNEVGLGLK